MIIKEATDDIFEQSMEAVEEYLRQKVSGKEEVEDQDRSHLEDQAADFDDTVSNERTAHFYLHKAKKHNKSSFESTIRHSRDDSVESQGAKSIHFNKKSMERYNIKGIPQMTCKPDAIEFKYVDRVGQRYNRNKQISKTNEPSAREHGNFDKYSTNDLKTNDKRV